ncbi:glycosyltransferase family 4 protein [Pseudoduganella sp. GCM10020061]|uniref:glycosyltransferase family 4 protein n=1 Tax=Pseudoduganella sp. GCM10020061 TaxID=3317345 RepID=UPI003638D4E6
MLFLLPRKAQTAPNKLMESLANSIPGASVVYLRSAARSPRLSLSMRLFDAVLLIHGLAKLLVAMRSAPVKRLHSSCFLPDVVAALLSILFRGVSYSTTVHSCISAEYALNYKWFGRIVYRVHLRALRRFDLVVCVSEQVARSLPDGLKKKVIYNAVDEKFFVVARWGVPRTTRRATRFLIVSALSPVKNVKLGITSFIEVAVDGDVLAVAGTGPCESELRSFAACRSDISFLGQVNDVPSLFSSYDCLIIPSLSEGFGLVFIEAMASGMPIVCLKLDIFVELQKIVGFDGVVFADSERQFARSLSQVRQLQLPLVPPDLSLFKYKKMIESYADVLYQC